jgi:hypothetical protein
VKMLYAFSVFDVFKKLDVALFVIFFFAHNVL